jgi:predicted nucleic acid-binding Zn ribbon protein
MKNFRNILVIILLSFSQILWGQSDSLHKRVKHVEIISEIQDTMALINKDDINKINKVFYERNVLDSLRVVDSCIIESQNKLKQLTDSIVATQINTIENQSSIIEQYENVISESNSEIVELEKKQKKDKNSKIAWQSISGTLAAVVLVLLLL